MAGGFSALSEEILIQIAEEVYNIYHSRFDKCSRPGPTFPIMKTLRETCRSFAYLRVFEKRLFETVVVRVTVEGLETLKATDLRGSGIAIHATKITFLTPQYSRPSIEQIEAQKRPSGVLGLLQGEPVRAALTMAFKELQRCRSVCFGDAECDGTGFGSDVELIGDAIFAAAVDSMSRAGTSPRHLEIHVPMSDEFGWDRLPGWAGLDLSQLITFNFDPHSDERPSFDDRVVYKRFTDNANSATASVMRKCSATLEEFTYNTCVMCWPGKEVVALPQLRVLALRAYGAISARNIADWIPGMPRLQRIKMSDAHVEEPGYRAWRLFYDAIRLHMLTRRPERFECSWTSDIWDGPMITFREEIGNVDRFLETGPSSEETDEFDRALALYMTGHAGWTHALRFMIDGYQSDDDIGTDEDEGLEASYFDTLDERGNVKPGPHSCSNCQERKGEAGDTSDGTDDE